MKFTYTWPITTDGSDSSGRMSLPYLCNMLQETATFHADQLGWGYDILKENNLQWVLSRQWIRMDRYPRWKENVTIETWPSGKSAITWNRDFIISDSEGRRLGEATSLWFVMDRESRRPRPAKFGMDLAREGLERVRDTDLKALPALVSPESVRKVTAGFHDIDVHDHINNLRYLTWMVDGLDASILQTHEAREIEINFLMEGFLNDVLEVNTDKPASDSKVMFQNLKRSTDGVELCRMRSTWIESE